MKHIFALVGCGRIGSRHAIQISKVAELAAVCDPDREKADILAAKYACRAYYSVEDLLASEENLDVASICSPNYLHAIQSIRCLENGLHVLCEKPMAINLHDGMAMVKTAAKVNRKLFVVKQNRFNPPVVLVKKLLDERKLGRIHAFQVNCFWNRGKSYYQSQWKGKQTLDGGLLFTQFSHFIDLLTWFLGEADEILAFRSNFLLKDTIEIEDTGFALIKMQNGAVGTLNYTVTSYLKNMEGSLTFFGETGTVKIGGEYLNHLEYLSVQGETMPPASFSREGTSHGFYHGSMSNHESVYINLIHALNNKDHTVVEAEDALKTIRMIEQIYRAAASGWNS